VVGSKFSKDLFPFLRIIVAMNLVGRLDRWLSENRPEYYSKLLPGATDEQLKSLKDSVGELPAGFEELYRWRNGQAPNCFKSLQENQCWMSLQDIQKARDTLNEMLDGEEFEQDHWWSKNWLPFLGNGGGDHLCLDLGEEFPGSKGQLLNFFHDYEDRSAEYPDFLTWLTIFVESLEAGMWKGSEPKSDDKWEEFRESRAPGFPREYEAG
jgi:cell wall assembly regulator SMI1